MLTVSQVADALRVPAHRVDYVIDSRRIKPAARAGHYRLFSDAQLPEINAALRECESRRAPLATAAR